MSSVGCVSSLIDLGQMGNIVQCQTRERLKPKCIKKSVNSGGVCVMVWGVFSTAEFGALIQLNGRDVNANVYQNPLKQLAVPSLQAHYIAKSIGSPPSNERLDYFSNFQENKS